MNTNIFLGETIIGENPTTSSKIESVPKVKPKNSKMISRQQYSLSLVPSSSFSLSYVLQLSVSECVINREDHSLFILIPNVTENTSYGLGCTTTDRETAEINPFPICKRNKTSNTKGSQHIPYSRRL